MVDAIPMTPSGKVDRRALLALRPARPTPAYVGPRSPTEQALAAIMAEVLELDRVSIHEDFFELGGNSLRAVQVIARVRKVLRVDLPVRSLFSEPTVSGLASEVDRAPVDASSVIPSTTRSVSRREALLARLSGLSDADVEALFGKLEVAESEGRQTETF